MLNSPLGLRSDSAALRRTDFLLVGCFSLLLFGYAMFDGRPLSLHEARLPETSREMMASHDWIIPRSGGRPWLERPPLPHWITVGISKVLRQHADRVWVVRLPSALMGCITVLLVTWMAGRWFGRSVGITSGLVLATMYEFYTYCTLAEDDIYLAALSAVAMACFVRSESSPDRPGLLRTIFGARHWSVIGFFAALGLTSLVKGPLMGAVGVIGALGTYLFWNRDERGIRRLCWLPGWLIFLALSLWWPIVVYHRYPELLENLKFDYAGGTSEYDHWFGYYVPTLLGALAPWTLAALLGLWITAGRALGERSTAERVAWCWAIVPVLILSIPHRKHHHYLVPSLGPWAVLTGIGLVAFAKWLFARPALSHAAVVIGLPLAGAGAAAIGFLHSRIPGPDVVTAGLAAAWVFCVLLICFALRGRNGSLLFGVSICGIALAFCWGQTFLPDLTTQDTAFLAQVESTVPRSEPLMINADLHGELDFFRIGFYLRPSAVLLHNLTYLRDRNLHAPEVFVITRAKDLARLQTLGTVESVLQSTYSRREKSPADRFTLFRLRFDPDLKRYPAPAGISTMEAMGRKKGPYCGPPMTP